MDQDTDRFPLHTAAREGNLPKAEGLVKTDPSLAKSKDADGRYPIHWAASSNCHAIALVLANERGFDPDVQDASGWTPLMISASIADSEPMLRLFLQKDANVDEKTNTGQTALHFVSSKNNLPAARILLLEANPPASTGVRDRRGQYPIHRAAAAGSLPILNLLVDKRSPLNSTDNEGYTPLHHAIAEGHGDVAIFLLKAGADFTIKTQNDELALDLAPDKDVRRYIVQGAEREGIDLLSPL